MRIKKEVLAQNKIHQCNINIISIVNRSINTGKIMNKIGNEMGKE